MAFGGFGIWWVSTVEIEDFWWVLGMWVTGFQGSFGEDGGGLWEWVTVAVGSGYAAEIWWWIGFGGSG